MTCVGVENSTGSRLDAKPRGFLAVLQSFWKLFFWSYGAATTVATIGCSWFDDSCCLRQFQPTIQIVTTKSRLFFGNIPQRAAEIVCVETFQQRPIPGHAGRSILRCTLHGRRTYSIPSMIAFSNPMRRNCFVVRWADLSKRDAC